MCAVRVQCQLVAHHSPLLPQAQPAPSQRPDAECKVQHHTLTHLHARLNNASLATLVVRSRTHTS